VFIGGSVSFDSVADVLEYNALLVRALGLERDADRPVQIA
jgi:hypothetical protein